MKNQTLIIFSVLCAICWGILIYAFTKMNKEAIESANDPAWACTALAKADLMGINGEVIGNIAKGDSLHLLASASDKPELVMVQTAKGERGWVNNTILPNYYKIRNISIEETAHFHNKTFEEKILGNDMETLEGKYAKALQIVPKQKTKKNPNENGFSAVFPMQVITKGSKTVTQFVTVQFQDSVAVAVETDSVFNKKASRAKIDPLIFFFLDKGICAKAGQQANPSYTSYLPEGVENKINNSWADRIGALLLWLVVMILMAAFPVLLVGPLVVLIYMYVNDDFYKMLLAIPLMLLAFVLFFTVYSILNSVSILLLIFNIIAIVAMFLYCSSEVY